MAITFLRRDYGDVVTIVRIVSTDDLATVGAADYIADQAANIIAANNGGFEWLANDVVLVSASDGAGLFQISSDFSSLNQMPGVLQSHQITLTAAQILGMYATPVAVLPAPVAGTINLITNAYLDVDYNSAQFAAGGAIALQYKNTANGLGVAASTTIAAATLNAVAADTVLTMTQPTSIVRANAVSEAVYLSNATAAFTTGDSTAVLTVYYRNLAI